MQPIDPITEKACKNLCGKSVLLYLNDGSQIFGVLSRLEKNTLILNEEVRPTLSGATSKKKGKTASKAKPVHTKKENAATSSPGPVLERLSFFGTPLFGGPAPVQGSIDIPLDRVAVMFSE